MIQKLAPYRKVVVAVLGVVLTGLNAYYGGDMTLQVVIAIATAFGVYQAPNTVKK